MSITVPKGVLELEPNTKLIEERVRRSIRGVLPCDLSNQTIFPEDVPIQPWDVIICSLGRLHFISTLVIERLLFVI
jgi:hypothetical protein